MKNIQTFIWFNDQAEEAANLYTSTFPNSKKIGLMPGPGGKPMAVPVDLNGHQFILFNGGPQFHPTHGISFTVYCASSEEAEKIWNKLSDSANVMMPLAEYPWSKKYGWIEDKFGVSWQITTSEEKNPVTPSLLFAGNIQGKAEEAINLYTSQFPNSSINFIARYEPGEPGPEGQIKFASFTLNNQPYIAMDSGHPMDNTMTPGISFFINCETQEEVDHFWDGLSEGGHQDRCGWLQDRFGVSWQVVPIVLGQLLSDPDRTKAQNVMQAMLQMNKLIIRDLEEAAEVAV